VVGVDVGAREGSRFALIFDEKGAGARNEILDILILE
jgi:hypothetical protein